LTRSLSHLHIVRYLGTHQCGNNLNILLGKEGGKEVGKEGGREGGRNEVRGTRKGGKLIHLIAHHCFPFFHPFLHPHHLYGCVLDMIDHRILSKRLPPPNVAERRYAPLPPSLPPSLSPAPPPLPLLTFPPPPSPLSSGALSEQQTSVYTRQILMGLRYLHENGIAHRYEGGREGERGRGRKGEKNQVQSYV